VAQGRDDIRIECAGTIAGWWFSSPARRGEELIAAGLLMLAGPVDLDELDRWMRIGWERRRGSTIPPGRPAKGLPIWVSPVEQLKTAEANSSEPAEAHSSELAPSETQSPPDRSRSGSNVLRVRNLKSAVQPFHDK
jgi:hypothetical protein